MKLNFKSYGQTGENIVILHGIFGMLDNWHSFASQLGKEHKVYTIDQRNHGRSPHSNDFNYPLMVEDLKEFIKDHDLEHVHIIGHSMGGKTAMHFALKYPDLIESLTVLDIGVKYYSPRHDYIFEALCDLNLQDFSSRNEINDFLEERIQSFGVRQFLLKNVRRNKEEKYEWKMNLPVIREAYEDLSAWIDTGQSFDKSSLFIRGANSSYILPDDWPGIQEIFPNSVLKTIPGAGHWLHAEKPYELLKMILEFQLELKAV